MTPYYSSTVVAVNEPKPIWMSHCYRRKYLSPRQVYEVVRSISVTDDGIYINKIRFVLGVLLYTRVRRALPYVTAVLFPDDRRFVRLRRGRRRTSVGSVAGREWRTLFFHANSVTRGGRTKHGCFNWTRWNVDVIRIFTHHAMLIESTRVSIAVLV